MEVEVYVSVSVLMISNNLYSDKQRDIISQRCQKSKPYNTLLYYILLTVTDVNALLGFRPRDFPPAEVVVSTDGFWPFAPYVTDAGFRDNLCGGAVSFYVVAMIDEWHAVVDFRVAAVV